LPTEAEWEYCCRAGTTTEWHTGTSLGTSQANFNGALANAAYPLGQTSVVGSYAPNAFGLRDMHGNAWGWCLDTFGPCALGPVADPFVSGGPLRSIRGGGWGNYWLDCRSAIRVGINPAFNYFGDGFRVVLAPILVP
jgi:formylglycine-generating enzyme required for sulfatase activity